MSLHINGIQQVKILDFIEPPVRLDVAISGFNSVDVDFTGSNGRGCNTATDVVIPDLIADFIQMQTVAAVILRV